MTTKPTFSLTLTALGDDSRPATVRLRTLLKIALRAFRLRCVEVREIEPTLPKEPTP